MEANAQERLAQMKKIGKIAKIVILVTSIVAAVLLVLYLLMPATNLYLEGVRGKYGKPGGYNYYGWQVALIGYGYPPVAILAMFDAENLAGDFIPTSHDFDTNAGLLLGILIPIIAIIVGAIIAKQMKNKGKAISEFACAGCSLFGAIMILCSAPLSIATATNEGTTPFYSSFLQPAVEAGTYTTCAYPIIAFVLLLLIALTKCAYGAFLLYQRAYARANKPEKTEKTEQN